MTKWGPTPSFTCMGEQNKTLPSFIILDDTYTVFPWNNDNTAKYTDSNRQYYHMFSKEFLHHPKQPLSTVDWDYPDLLSVYVSRDPVDLLLSGDGMLIRDFGDEKDRTEEQWHRFAESWQADNYALVILPETNSVYGNNTTFECLESAKTLLQRFTFVLDQACLIEGIQRKFQNLFVWMIK